MARKNTLKDLSEFLSENPNEIELDNSFVSKEEFINRKPNSLVEVPKATTKDESFKDLSGIELKDIANHLHTLSKKNNQSFAETWMELLKIASKQDPLLENTSFFQAVKSFRKNSTSVFTDGMAYLLKRK